MPSPDTNQIDSLHLAVQTLEAQRAVLGDAVVDSSIAAIRKQLVELEGSGEHIAQQRKLATVLFTDIVGHTELIQDLDPEDNLEIIDAALISLAKAIESHGGRIARYQGDGFKAIFGIPAASESDPENAIRAGLGIIAAAQEYSRKLEADWNLKGFNIRVGIDTGLVVTGGETEAEDTIKGLAVNLAARLESAAPAGGLLISHHTYQHVRGVFDVTPQEPIRFKGFPEPVSVYLVRRAKARAFRLGTRGVEGIETKTIGRDGELHQLQRVYQTAMSQRQTTVVTLMGEAGVGKSRLLYEFSNWLELQPELIRLFKGRATQQTEGSPYFLLRDTLASRFQILDSDTLSVVNEKFVAGLAEFLPKETTMKGDILGAWLGYGFGDSPHLRPLKDEPEKIKNRATLYLAQFITAIGEQQSVVLFLEDIHWADDGSLDTIIDLVRRRPQLPFLIVCLARPTLFQRRSAWGDKIPIHTQLDLAPLSGEDSRALVVEILRLIDPLPPILLDLVSSRAEGNPFYAEELVKMLIDDGVIITETEDWHVVSEQLLELKVPDTLTGVLQARLDRLRPEEKRAIQQASVIGRVFWDRALMTLPHEEHLSLPALQEKEFIFPQPDSAFAGTAEYIFKHAILHDVTYESVLKRVRRQYHELVAAWLVSAAEENGRSDEYSAVIGEHYQLADKPEESAVWYGRAGQQATASFAHEEALRYLGLAYKFTPEDDPAALFAVLKSREKTFNMLGDRESQREDLGRMESLAQALSITEKALVTLRQSKLAELNSDFEQSIQYAKSVVKLGEEGIEKGLVVDGFLLWGFGLMRQGINDSAQERYETGLHLAREINEQKMIADCLHGLGFLTNQQSNYITAKEYLKQSLLVYREIGDRSGEVASLNALGMVAWNQGDYVRAKRIHQKSLAIHREIGARQGEAMSLNNLGIVAFEQRDYAATKSYYEQSLVIYREIGQQLGEGYLLLNLGHLGNRQGDYQLAKEYLQNSLMILQTIGNRDGEGICLINLGDVAMDQGDYALAMDYLQQALTIEEDLGSQWGEGICCNNIGAVAMAQANLLQANNYYQHAFSIHLEMNQPRYLVEDWAGLARLKLAQGDQKSAQVYVQKVLDYLQENTYLDGAENPMRAFHFVWEVLEEFDQKTAVDEILVPAAQIIQEYLDNNSDPDTQEMYLNQPHHKVLWSAWKNKLTD